VLRQPTEYISFQSDEFTEANYNVDQGIGNCTSSTEEVDGRDETVITCPQGELLTDGIKQANLGFSLSDTDIGTFHIWRERRVMSAFITLRFLDQAITPTRVEVYCLVLQDLRIREPQNIRLHSSSANSIYPETEIRGVDSSVFTVVDSGTTIISRTSSDEEEEDENTPDITFSNYEYRKYSLTIPEVEQVSLQYLRISLDVNNWLFVNEVQVYQGKDTLTINTFNALKQYFLDNEALSNSTTTLSDPTFIFPTINPYILHVTMIPSNLTINCTVTSEEDLSQLTTTWSYNGVNISTSDKYTVTDSRLTIRSFTQEDIGVYRCSVQHPSGWYGNREYFILINQGKQ